jgi:Fe-S cluster biogenesis protein NfuA
LQGSCHGCPSSTATLKQAIEEAIFKSAPDVERVEAEGVASPQLIALDSLFLECPIP